MRNLFSLLVFVVSIVPDINAGYSQEELFIIQWGEGNSELKLDPPHFSPPDTIEGIVTDGEFSIGSGPDEVFVDRNENFIFSCHGFGQLKGFDHTGELLFNFSSGETEFNPDIHKGDPDDIYVDSLFRVFLTNSPGWNFIPVFDYEGNLLDKLNPYAPDTNVEITSLFWQYNGDVSFYCREYGFYTCKNGEFLEGGTGSFLGRDGIHYDAVKHFPDTLEFIRSVNHDTRENAEVVDRTSIVLPLDSLLVGNILTGGDGSRLYVLVRMDYAGSDEILEFDLKYQLLDRMQLECWTEESIWHLPPFVRYDGSIYEFRCFEDGMHVIRWSKE